MTAGTVLAMRTRGALHPDPRPDHPMPSGTPSRWLRYLEPACTRPATACLAFHDRPRRVTDSAGFSRSGGPADEFSPPGS